MPPTPNDGNARPDVPPATLPDAAADPAAEGERERLAAIVAASRDAIWGWDLDGAITTWNPAAERLFGHAPAEIVGRSIHTLIPPERRPAAAEVLRRLRAGGAFDQFETVRQRRDGSRLAVSLTVFPVHDRTGAMVGGATICRDVTRRRQRTEDLRRSEELLRLSQTAAGIGSFEWNVESGTFRYSPEFSALYGLDTADTEWRREDWLDRARHEDRPSLVALRREAFAHRVRENSIEFRIVRPDGAVRWMEGRSRTAYGKDGRPLRVVGVNMEITARKEAEARQQLLQHELDHRVKNILATVQGLLVQTRAAGGTVETVIESFRSRLGALARAHDALVATHFAGAPLRHVAEQEVGAFLTAEGDNISLAGDDLRLTPRATQTLTLVLHELATNAAKHGALSVPEGRVDIRWSVAQRDGGARLLLEWTERHGPALTGTPQRQGFGRTVLERGVAFSLAGEARLEFAAEGLRYRMDVPADGNLDTSGPAEAEAAKPA